MWVSVDRGSDRPYIRYGLQGVSLQVLTSDKSNHVMLDSRLINLHLSHRRDTLYPYDSRPGGGLGGGGGVEKYENNFLEIFHPR